jgi:hypothetical protein
MSTTATSRKGTPPPPPSRKGSPPEAADILNNLAKPEPGAGAQMSFRVPKDFQKEFKVAAATYGITQSELLIEAFEAWQKNHG